MKTALRVHLQTVIAIMQVLVFAGMAQSADIIKIGLNMPYTGPREAAGLASRAGADMAKDQINAAGGLKVGGKSYMLEYVYADNHSDAGQAVNNALKLITKNNVLAIIGPNDSSKAIPAGGICESFKTPMVSPTSTNPKTTLDRPFVFRACFLDPFQGEAMASFATNEFGAKKAAVLFNIADAYPRGLAEFFKAAFEAKNGVGSVVAFESFLSSEKNLSGQLGRIVASGADVLFVPQYDNEVASIVKQAKALGWNKVILGGDAWETTALMESCGDDCKGYFFSSHFAALGAKGKSQEFVEKYKAKMKQVPTGDGALGYDSANLLFTAIGSLDSLDNNLIVAREALKDKLASLKGFQGVSGTLDMTAGGDPIKSAVVIRINEQGAFELYKIQNP